MREKEIASESWRNNLNADGAYWVIKALRARNDDQFNCAFSHDFDIVGLGLLNIAYM